jgi:copper chaperone CopZ
LAAPVDSGWLCARVNFRKTSIMDQVLPGASPDVLETREIKISGMGCENCVRKLERVLHATEGVKEARVDRIAGRATVTFDPTRTSIPALHEVITRSGYRAGAVEV